MAAVGGTRFRILYVDDEAINLRLMQDVFEMVLKRPGTVATATSADEALKRLGAEAFDVIISDQRMPGVSGTALLARARDLAPMSARMILTGFPSDEEVQEALESGVAEAIVPKPWKSRDLEGQIQALLARRNGEA